MLSLTSLFQNSGTLYVSPFRNFGDSKAKEVEYRSQIWNFWLSFCKIKDVRVTVFVPDPGPSL